MDRCSPCLKPACLILVATTVTGAAMLTGCAKQPLPCNDFQFRDMLGGLYVKLLKDKDPTNSLQLDNLKAILTEVYIKHLSYGSSTCRATLSFSDGRKKLIDNVGVNIDRGNIGFEQEAMSNSGQYTDDQVQIFVYIRKRHEVEFDIAKAEGEGNVNISVKIDISK